MPASGNGFDDQFRWALQQGLVESGLSLEELAERAGVGRNHLNLVLLGRRSLPRPSTRRRLASALASTGLVSEEVIEAVAGGEHLDLDILVDRTKAGDLYRACVFHPDAGRRLRRLAIAYLSSEYDQLSEGEGRRRLAEFVLFWVRTVFYGMGSKHRVEEARLELRSGRASPADFSAWLEGQEGPLETMALALAAVTWWNMALLFPLTRARPPYLELLHHREELPPDVAAVLEEAAGAGGGGNALP